MAQFDVYSPDGFAIHREETYPSVEIALEKLREWIKRYEFQGYYSSVKYGRIPLDELEIECHIVEIFEDTNKVGQLLFQSETKEELEREFEGENE